jgi:hypothetical protein
MEAKRLDLKVTVVSRPDPDAALARMNRTALRLSDGGGNSLKVEKAERADGLPFGLEAAFEDYWRRDVGIEPGDENSDEKLYARQAYLAAAKKFGKERG